MGELKPAAYLEWSPKNHPSTDQPHNIVMTMKKKRIKNSEMKEKNIINAKKAKKKFKKEEKIHHKKITDQLTTKLKPNKNKSRLRCR